MTISQLIDELAQYDPNLPVGVVVSYVDHGPECSEYCYCSSEDHEFGIESVSKEEDTKKKTIKKLWIRGI